MTIMIADKMTLIDIGLRVGQQMVLSVYGIVYSRGGRSFWGWLRKGMLSLRFWLGLRPFAGRLLRLFWLFISLKPWTFIGLKKDGLSEMVLYNYISNMIISFCFVLFCLFCQYNEYID